MVSITAVQSFQVDVYIDKGCKGPRDPRGPYLVYAIEEMHTENMDPQCLFLIQKEDRPCEWISEEYCRIVPFVEDEDLPDIVFTNAETELLCDGLSMILDERQGTQSFDAQREEGVKALLKKMESIYEEKKRNR